MTDNDRALRSIEQSYANGPREEREPTDDERDSAFRADAQADTDDGCDLAVIVRADLARRLRQIGVRIRRTPAPSGST